MIKKIQLILTNVDSNNNKFWTATINENHSVFVHWGRVGTSGSSQTKQFGSLYSAESFVESKSKEKQRKGYQIVNTVAETIDMKNIDISTVAKTQIKNDGNNETLKLIETLSKENIHNILSNTKIQFENKTGLFSTPLGIIDKKIINESRQLLDNMTIYIENKDFFSNEYKKMLNQYLMYIPCKVPPKLKSDTFFKNNEDILKHYDILDSLLISYEQYEQNLQISNKTEIPELFNCSINIVTDNSIIDNISKYYHSTKKSMHSCHKLEIETVYKIDIDKMNENFEKNKIGNIRELWHGTKVSNILSILKNGMIIPPSTSSHVTGRMFGDGIYFSDISTKALNYSYGYWDNTRNMNCYMFLASVAMGKEYIPSGSIRNIPVGYDSIFAKEGVSGVMNNEMIVPKIEQIKLNYLIKFKGN